MQLVSQLTQLLLDWAHVFELSEPTEVNTDPRLSKRILSVVARPCKADSPDSE